ncbi:uncharacterized protein LAJ45_01500 [Morchella importuna]|uniref:uncharacterized protein n=1 Tax=Morchella importuna TaxID=1174673 RepID=UPI001E8E1372|nr:uncharacterized protein LAJ45_01500 [Morchella importuna]KAH8154967.1 hypothetical protein LAJ45_01500 [Morchella importuna]
MQAASRYIAPVKIPEVGLGLCPKLHYALFLAQRKTELPKSATERRPVPDPPGVGVRDFRAEIGTGERWGALIHAAEISRQELPVNVLYS